MSGVLRSSMAVTVEQLSGLVVAQATSTIAGWPDLCHWCDSRPVEGHGVICKICRATQEKESE